MPNGRGHIYQTSSTTVIALGSSTESVLKEFSDSVSEERLERINFLHITSSLANVKTESEADFDVFEVTETNESSEHSHLEKETSNIGAASSFRNRLDNRQNFFQLFEILESNIVQTAKEYNESGTLHQVLLLGDLTGSLTRGILPLVSAMVTEACAAAHTHVTGLLYLPVSDTNPMIKQVERKFREAYVGLCELRPLISGIKPGSELNINIDSDIALDGRSEIRITDRVFDFLGLLGYQDIDQSGTQYHAESTASVLSVLTTEALQTSGYGPLHLPGAGWKGGLFDGYGYVPKWWRENKPTPISWIEISDGTPIESQRFDPDWWGQEDWMLPINYFEYVDVLPEIGVYDVEEDRSSGVEVCAIDQIGSVTGSVIFHPDVDKFAVSPYFELRNKYPEIGSKDKKPEYLSRLIAYPELFDFDALSSESEFTRSS